MFISKTLLNFEDWKKQNIEDVADNYEFDLNETLKDADIEKMYSINSFQDYILDMYLTYIEEWIDENKTNK